MSDRPELVQKAFEARDTGFDYGPYAKALLSYIEALEAAALARAEANAGEPVIGDERIYPNEPFGSALTAGKPNREELESAAKVALLYLDSGFLACDVCGHQMPTKDTDAAHTLRDALTAGKPEQAVPSGWNLPPAEVQPADTLPSEPEHLISKAWVHEGCAIALYGTNDKLIGWIDTHAWLKDRVYRDRLLPAAPTAGGGDAE